MSLSGVSYLGRKLRCALGWQRGSCGYDLQGDGMGSGRLVPWYADTGVRLYLLTAR